MLIVHLAIHISSSEQVEHCGQSRSPPVAVSVSMSVVDSDSELFPSEVSSVVDEPVVVETDVVPPSVLELEFSTELQPTK